MLRTGVFLCVMCAVVLPGFCAEESVFNIDFACGWAGYFRPGEWTPATVSISSTLTKPFQGELNVSARQDSLNTMNITRPFVLTPEIPLHIPLALRLAFAADRCRVVVRNDRGRTVWRHDYSLWDYSRRNRYLTVVGDVDLLVGLVGARKFGLAQLPKKSVCITSRGQGMVYLGDVLPRLVPWDWSGFSSLDVLILYNPDFSRFNRHQVQGMCDWVSNGGKLLVVLGSEPIPSGSALAEMLPFEPGPAEQTVIDTQALLQLQLDADEPERAVCRPLAAKSRPGSCCSEVKSGRQRIFGVGYAGFGRVAVLGFDPSRLSARQRQRSSRFWSHLISTLLDQPEGTATQPQADGNPRGVEFQLVGDVTHPNDADGGIKLIITGLDPGRYKMTSYHNNPNRQHSPIDIWVNGSLCARHVAQSSVRDDRTPAARAVSSFVVAADGNAVVEFKPRESPYNRRAVLCGLDLARVGPRGTYERLFGVDIGARGQAVAPGYVGVGMHAGARPKSVTFDSSHGLPEGVTMTLEPLNPDDTLQFNPTAPLRSRPRPGGELPFTAGVYRGIKHVEDIDSAAVDPGMQQVYQNQYRMSLADSGSNAVMQYLYDIAQMKPLSIWWVMGLLGLLAVLLGPVDYQVLKRIGRLPLTWVTCAVWIAVFTAGAYYGVQALRGGDMQVRAVSVIDSVAGSPEVWTTRYLGIFAPRSGDYRLQETGAGRPWAGQWWSGMAPSQEWANPYSTQLAGRTIYYLQQDGYNAPYSVPINIWDTQCLCCEARVESCPIEAKVERHNGRLIVNITNNSDSKITRGYAMLEGRRGIWLGQVEPRQSRRFQGVANVGGFREEPIEELLRRGTEYRLALSGAFREERTFVAHGSLNRTLGIRGYLKQGAVLVCVEFADAPLPLEVANRPGNYTHRQVVRQIVFPKEAESAG